MSGPTGVTGRKSRGLSHIRWCLPPLCLREGKIEVGVLVRVSLTVLFGTQIIKRNDRESCYGPCVTHRGISNKFTFVRFTTLTIVKKECKDSTN